MRASFDGRSVIVRTVPVPRLFEPSAERVDGVEAETLDPREIISPVGLSIRLRMVPLNSSAHSGQLTERLGDIADAVDLTAPHVDRAIDVAHHPESDPRRVLGIENVALGGAVAPDRDGPAAFLRVVEFLDQRWND